MEQLQRGLSAPICITWELTYACNLACIHCLSSSGKRDPGELSTPECESVIEQLEASHVFYVNIGGGEPTLRGDFWHLLGYAIDRSIGIKFSTNGSRITPAIARRLASASYVDIQVSVDGANASVNDAIRGRGSFDTATTAMGYLADAGATGFKVSVVVTRGNVDQLDELRDLADRYGAILRLTRLRPSGRGTQAWARLHLTQLQQRTLYSWLMAHPDTLTGDSFFHLSALGEALPGLNLCGAGRVVCLIDPLGDVYACPFVLDEQFRAGNVRAPGGFADVWRDSPVFRALREPSSGGACTSCGQYSACQGGCMAAKFFTGLPLNGPDPECVDGYGEVDSREDGPPVAAAETSMPLPVIPGTGMRLP
jgi:mycofactocin radical SAM maturase